MKSNLSKIIVGCCILFCLSGCGDTIISTIPNFPVNIELSTIGFNSPGQVVYFKNRIKEADRIGFGGILVNVNYEGKYMAFDMACPYEANANVRVYPNGEMTGDTITTAIYAICEKCGTKFNIYDDEYARPAEGPATQGLKKYYTALTSYYTLRIYR